MESKVARQYLSQVRRILVCDRNDRRRLLARCKAMVDDFQQENPDEGYDALVSAFGDPKSFAAELLSGLEASKVEAAQKRQRLIHLGTLAVVITILVAISCFWCWKYVKARFFNEHITIVQGPVTTLDDEEFRELWDSMSAAGGSATYNEEYYDN